MPNESIKVNYGGSATFTVTPDAGYYLKEISCTNGYTTNASTGTSTINAQTVTVSNNNKTEGSTCTVTFEKSEYDVEIKSNNTSYGTVSPTSLKISYGDAKTFTATPKTGYYLSSVSCTNDYTATGTTGTSAISAQTKTVTNNNQRNGSICTATFAARTFSVSFDANGGNAVSTVLTVTYNSSTEYLDPGLKYFERRATESIRW